jgi:hypothetical protein
VAFTKQVWQRAGGYPEWLDYCEDVVFDLAVLAQGERFVWAPQAVAHFRPRPSLAAFFRQYFRYARGDGKANLWLQRHLLRYGVYMCGLAGLALTPRFPALFLVLAVVGLAYLAAPVRRLAPWLQGQPNDRWAAALALVPVIRFTGDVAKMAGYPVGVWWRLRNREAASGGLHQHGGPPANA